MKALCLFPFCVGILCCVKTLSHNPKATLDIVSNFCGPIKLDLTELFMSKYYSFDGFLHGTILTMSGVLCPSVSVPWTHIDTVLRTDIVRMTKYRLIVVKLLSESAGMYMCK